MSSSAGAVSAAAEASAAGESTKRSYFTSSRNQPRARRAADVTTVVIGVLLVAWSLFAHGHSDPLQDALTQFAQALPEWAVALFTLGYTLGLIFAVVVVIALVVQRRWSGVRDVALAGGVAGVVTLVLVEFYGSLWPPFFTELLDDTSEPQFPVLRVATVSAILVVSTPYLARPLRRLGWAIVLIVSGAAIALALSVPSGAVAALGIGLICAGGVLLAFGSPLGYPDTDVVAAALNRVGIDVSDLRLDPDQSWGVRRLVGATADGVDVEVKAYGRDATDSQVMAKVWHGMKYRGGANRITFSRLQSVEHEALVTMLAEKAGVATPTVLAAASATEEVAVLVTTRVGTPLHDVDAGSLADSTLVSLWRQLADMHAAGITHGQLDAEAVRVTDTGCMIGEFSSGSVVYRESDAALDTVHLLFGTASVVGVERAVAAAGTGLGTDRLALALGYLQPPALSKRERHSVDKAATLLKELRTEVSAVTGTEVPEPVKLRRVSPRDIITIVLVLMFVSALVPMLTGMDWSEVWSSLQGASWGLAVLALLAGQLAFIPQGTAMMSAVGRSIPLRPMTILQPAVAFISFAVPGMAGRVTMEGAFLYKYGIEPAVSVTKGAVDAVSGFLVQCVLLVLAFLTGAISLASATSSDGSSTDSGGISVSWGVIAIVVLLAVATVIAVWTVPRLHNAVVPQLRKSWDALTEVLKSPKLALGLLGSQVAVQLLWGLALWISLLALGVHLNLLTCTAVVVATCLLQGIVPVPGGIGVSEAVMSAFLVPLGVSADVAMGATLIWRLATFYLPATEGFFASRWLSAHGYL